jgi:hypothetical protein
MNVSWAILQIGLGDLFNDWNDGDRFGIQGQNAD